MYPVSVQLTSSASGKFKANKNNLMPLILTPLQGSLPQNAGLLDGSVAQSLGIQPNHRYILNIVRNGTIKTISKKTGLEVELPQYQYTVVACLGASFDTMVAEKLVASMNFSFGGGSIAPTAPVASTPVSTEETIEEFTNAE